MNRNQLWGILIGVFVVLVLIFIFLRTGGPEVVEDLDNPGATAAEDSPTAADEGAATSTEPAAEGE